MNRTRQHYSVNYSLRQSHEYKTQANQDQQRSNNQIYNFIQFLRPEFVDNKCYCSNKNKLIEGKEQRGKRRQGNEGYLCSKCCPTRCNHTEGCKCIGSFRMMPHCVVVRRNNKGFTSRAEIRPSRTPAVRLAGASQLSCAFTSLPGKGFMKKIRTPTNMAYTPRMDTRTCGLRREPRSLPPMTPKNAGIAMSIHSRFPVGTWVESIFF